MADDCAARLTEARSALHGLLTGQAVVSVSVEGESIGYAQADQRKLEAYVAQLEYQCGGVNNMATRRRRPGQVVY